MSERPVWRPARPAASETAEPDRPLRCGGEGPILSVDERFEMMRALKREWDEEKARTAEEEKKAEKPADDEDEQRVIERFRNDRYAVKLLRQADDVWGGGAGDTGALG
ncbi:hypothetical protein HH310_37905 [Actinoplanes sp. TBRC 11911]|uniref:hypothetical protein n=1 Tax=Actinoplanes sp. TBRC 11911 TaxID=2729386 RepID=UPI00145F2FB6|nr:hypothetical protein [Actinoplanes sp. TBRC 11911]NMO56937.1 hypothetical protein [Actinoplanes sp. TBRC 11911]